MNVRVPPVKDEYVAMMKTIGFTKDLSFESLEPHVLTAWPTVGKSSGFSYIVKQLLEYVDYCAIAGALPGSVSDCPPKPKVAIIGSEWQDALQRTALPLTLMLLYSSRGTKWVSAVTK